MFLQVDRVMQEAEDLRLAEEEAKVSTRISVSVS